MFQKIEGISQGRRKCGLKEEGDTTQEWSEGDSWAAGKDKFKDKWASRAPSAGQTGR